jgi:hypothetical protein
MGRAGEGSLNEGVIPLRERRTLYDEWFEFARQCIPEQAPEVQRVEMRRAFYAGAAVLFSLVTGGLDADKEPTDLDVAYLESLNQELKLYSQDLSDGKA